MANAHRHVAFPLPGVPLVFRSLRPKAYPEKPQTLGEHLLKRRAKAGLTQGHVARQLRVNTWTYLLWETGKTMPTVRHSPAIFGFLGYDPFPAPATLPERIATKRRRLGLSVEKAADLLDVDEGTFRRWESGEWQPRFSSEIVNRFLNTPCRTRGKDPE